MQQGQGQQFAYGGQVIPPSTASLLYQAQQHTTHNATLVPYQHGYINNQPTVNPASLTTNTLAAFLHNYPPPVLASQFPIINQQMHATAVPQMALPAPPPTQTPDDKSTRLVATIRAATGSKRKLADLLASANNESPRDAVAPIAPRVKHWVSEQRQMYTPRSVSAKDGIFSDSESSQESFIEEKSETEEGLTDDSAPTKPKRVIWYYMRPLYNEHRPFPPQFPHDSSKETRLSERPNVPLVGCKLCSDKCKWTVYVNNKNENSNLIWNHILRKHDIECEPPVRTTRCKTNALQAKVAQDATGGQRLKVDIEKVIGEIPQRKPGEPFVGDDFALLAARWIKVNYQLCAAVDCQAWRDMVRYLCPTIPDDELITSVEVAKKLEELEKKAAKLPRDA